MRVVEFSLYFPLLSTEGCIPDNLEAMRGENMGGQSYGQNGGTGCDCTTWCTTAKRLRSPLLVNSVCVRTNGFCAPHTFFSLFLEEDVA